MRSLAGALALLLIVFAGAAGAAADDLELGRALYVDGVGEGGGEVTAALGEGGAEVPASMLPCASCHGLDGRGNPEGGVSPSDLTWESLTRPYGVDHPSGRSHPPYDERSLIRAIAMGVDPAGNELHVAMPRYRLSQAEGAAIVAYIKTLGRGADPGVSDDAVRLGVVQPPSGTLPGLGDAIKAALEAAAARANAAGGVYNRRIELEFVDVPAPAAERRDAVAEFLESADVFALTSSFLAGAEVEIAALVGEKRVPLVGPFTIYPELGFPLNRYVFYVLSGLTDQARALVDFATVRLGPTPGPVALVHMDEPQVRAVAEAAVAQGKRQEPGSVWTAIRSTAYARGALEPAAIVEREKRAGTKVLIFFGSEVETRDLLEEAERQEWRPFVLLLSPLAGSGAMAAQYGFQDRVFIAFASLPTDRSPEALADYQSLAAEYGLPSQFPTMQLAAIGGLSVTLGALERAGRELSREKLVEALESLYGFETGVTPPITYGPNRRVGALGAYVLPLDPRRRLLAADGRWVTPR